METLEEKRDLDEKVEEWINAPEAKKEVQEIEKIARMGSQWANAWQEEVEIDEEEDESEDVEDQTHS